MPTWRQKPSSEVLRSGECHCHVDSLEYGHGKIPLTGIRYIHVLPGIGTVPRCSASRHSLKPEKILLISYHCSIYPSY
eukprot:SAG31_NODE_1702_length_7496_cov_2.367311_6_plen_78_part_00